MPHLCYLAFYLMIFIGVHVIPTVSQFQIGDFDYPHSPKFLSKMRNLFYAQECPWSGSQFSGSWIVNCTLPLLVDRGRH